MYAGKSIHKLFMLVNNLTIFYKSKKTVHKITFEEKDLVLRDLGFLLSILQPYLCFKYFIKSMNHLYLLNKINRFRQCSFMNVMHAYVCVQSLSHVQLFATLWTVVCQAPPSMEFSRQEYCSRLSFPPPGDLPNQEIKLSPATQADSLSAEPF